MKSIIKIIFVLVLFANFSPAQAVSSDEGLKDINGTELYVKTIGSGEPIVIVHGGPGMDHSYFLPQFRELAKHYKLIFYDQRASGKSTANVDTNTITMDTFVGDLEGIREYFGIDKMNLLGHSWGGLVAMFYAVKHPGNLKSLILSNPTPLNANLRNATFTEISDRMRGEDNSREKKLVRTKAFRERDPKTMAEFFRLLFSGTFYKKKYIDSLTLHFPDDYAVKSKLINYLQKDTALTNYDLTDKLTGIICPTLIIGGSYDIIPPRVNALLEASIKNSRLVTLSHCGHFPFVEDKKEYFNLIENFINNVIKEE